jgi:hypothetical protein
MTVKTVDELLAALSTGASSDNTIESSLIVDIIDTFEDLKADTTDTATLLAAGTAVIVLPDSDPAVVGALWNDSGTITVSAG